MPLISNIYLILLLPLLAAFLCVIVKNKSANYLITISVIAIMFLGLLQISPNFLRGNYVFSNISRWDSSLILNYNFNLIGIIFVLIILFQKLVALIFFKEQIWPKIIKNNATFYFAFLINIFAISLIFTSSNFVNLFLAVEIYSVSLLLSKIAVSTKEQKKITLDNIFVHNIATIIFVFCLLFIYLSFGSFDFVIIRNFFLDNKINQYEMLLIVALLIVFVVLRFFQFWNCFKNIKIKSPIQQYLSFQELFIQPVIGIYLLTKLSNIFFFNGQFLQDLNFDKYLIILLSSTLIYFSFLALKYKNIKLLSIYYAIVHVALILLSILLNSQASFHSFFYYLLSLSLSLYILYLLSVIIENYVFSGKVNLRSQKNKGAIIICNIISVVLLIMAISPISILFFGNFYLIKSSFSHPLYFVIIPSILVSSIAFFISALNARSDLSKKILKEKIIKKLLKKSQINLSFFSYNFYLFIIISLLALNVILIYYNFKVSEVFLEISKFMLANQI